VAWQLQFTHLHCTLFEFYKRGNVVLEIELGKFREENSRFIRLSIERIRYEACHNIVSYDCLYDWFC
jgi:hypothetical protein